MWGWLKGDRRQAEQPVVNSVTRSDAEYLRLLNDLLDRLAVELGYATLTAWSIIQGVKEEELAVWLRGAAEQFDENLRGRLELLVKLGRGDLSLVAEEIWGAAKTTVQDFSSDNAEEWFDRACNLSMEGKYKEAISFYTQTINIKPSFYQAWHNQANAFYQIGEYENAIKSYDETIRIQHDSYTSWNLRGLSLNRLTKHIEAIYSFDQSIKNNCFFYDAWNNKAGACDFLKLKIRPTGQS